MTLSQDLISHAFDLLSPAANNGNDPSEISSRRSISASYYALFHAINADAVALIAPDVPPELNHRIQRWFDHAEMKRICGRFTKPVLDQPLKGLIGSAASEDLQRVASAFAQLQDDRHSADYDLSFQVSGAAAFQKLALSVFAISAWDRLKGSSEANIFILSLLLWKNWEKERA